MVSELLKRKEALLAKGEAGNLALTDVSEHQLHLGKITNTLRETREHIVRKHQMTEALLAQCRDARRRQKLEGTRASLLRQEELFNYNFRRVREEAEWFFSTPAFKLAEAPIGTHTSPGHTLAGTHTSPGHTLALIPRPDTRWHLCLAQAHVDTRTLSGHKLARITHRRTYLLPSRFLIWFRVWDAPHRSGLVLLNICRVNA